jgi:mRNA-degrading endonuclease RelE of RelBE toxin-antitoxin system
MDRLTKLLKKLTPKERTQLEEVLSSLLSERLTGLDIKKLKGRDDIYRVRSGALRIIFRKDSGEIRVLDAARRGETTYRDF